MGRIDEYCSDYLDKVYYYSLRYTKSELKASELASDISYEVIRSLSRGAEPENFRAWVWKVADNVRRRSYRSVGELLIPLDAYESWEPEDDSLDVAEKVVLADELMTMRRCLCHIRRDYREILVAHYINNMSVSEISRRSSLPLGTVKTKLQSSRKALKAGMEMTREYGKRSYSPDDVYFTNSCSTFGAYGQPWTILNHLLYKNIFLEIYDNPSTAEELSMSLGIALPYMESELDYLAAQTFIEKVGKRYYTTFPIISAEAQRKVDDKECEVGELIAEYIDRMCELLFSECSELISKNQSPSEAKWTLAARIFDYMIPDSVPNKYRARPDGGAWEIIGFQVTDKDYSFSVGLHSSDCEMLGRPDILVSQYRYNYKNLAARTPHFLTASQVARLYEITFGTRLDIGIDRDAAEGELLEYGYIKRKADRLESLAIVYDRKKISAALSDSARRELMELAARGTELRSEYKEFAEAAYIDDLPSELRQNEDMRNVIKMNCALYRDCALKFLIRDGKLEYSDNITKALGLFF